MNIVTKILLWLNYKCVGQDKFGNKYYESLKLAKGKQRTRSVMYKGKPESTKVPPGWHAWLHYLSDEIPADNQLEYDWQDEYLPNLTGTKYAYRPKGHMTSSGVRDYVSSDYHAWRPDD